MALTDFFRINMPYGMKRNDQNQWFTHNREYVPLGWNSRDMKDLFYQETGPAKLPVYTEYKGLTEKAIFKVITEEQVQRDEDGNINHIFFYNDATNPMNDSKGWENYFKIIKAFSKFAIKNN